MARIPAGREVLQITVDVETASLLRVKAALRRVTVGRLVEELARQAYTRDQVLEDWAAESVPAPRLAAPARNPIAKAPRTPQEAPRRRGGPKEVMAWDDLVAALESQGKTHKGLREHLGLSNISIWAKDGVPAKHVPQIREFLGQA